MHFEGRERAENGEFYYVKYRCPRPSCAKPLVRFKVNSGYTNRYIHLRRCFARGLDEKEQDSVILELYNEARLSVQRQEGSICSHFSTRTVTDYDKAVHCYLRLIIIRGLPLSIVEDEEYRSFCKFDVRISYRTVCKTILRMVEIVEKRISNEMRERESGP